MGASMAAAAAAAFTVVLMMKWVWRVVNWVWLKPKSLEKCLRRQGLAGNSYRILFGDMKDSSRLKDEAKSKPISFTNDYLHRADPLLHQTIKNYGKNSFVWMGAIPKVNITEPELIKEIFSKMYNFQKPILSKVFMSLVPGLAQYEGEKWAKHRKIINPAFHIDKLKLMLPAFSTSCDEMIAKWEKIVSETGSHEVDLKPHLKILTADVISRSAFGSNYEEGRKIFQLLNDQIDLALKGFLTTFIPGGGTSLQGQTTG
ncbi:hypothetical protein Nepgr_016039 [Nepenthes gracilis]|uniref:Cytochrome P450 n=1 Tax=Nepenthes gracilis TaxID=150966 RepID=A0AAD3SMS4_NEPGR|nr:hypothetical protein Nepgr_016039 [Nepenthes gracilis]